MDSPASISWRGDSNYFALFSQDACDNIGRVRVYNSDDGLALHAVGVYFAILEMLALLIPL